MEKFMLGVVLGAMGGALAVANSYKVRSLVKKGQDEAKKRLEEMIDERLEKMDCTDGNCADEKSSDEPKKRVRKNA